VFIEEVQMYYGDDLWADEELPFQPWNDTERLFEQKELPEAYPGGLN